MLFLIKVIRRNDVAIKKVEGFLRFCAPLRSHFGQQEKIDYTTASAAYGSIKLPAVSAGRDVIYEVG